MPANRSWPVFFLLGPIVQRLARELHHAASCKKAISKNAAVKRHERWGTLQTSSLIQLGASRPFADELTIDFTQQTA